LSILLLKAELEKRWLLMMKTISSVHCISLII